MTTIVPPLRRRKFLTGGRRVTAYDGSIGGCCLGRWYRRCSIVVVVAVVVVLKQRGTFATTFAQALRWRTCDSLVERRTHVADGTAFNPRLAIGKHTDRQLRASLHRATVARPALDPMSASWMESPAIMEELRFYAVLLLGLLGIRTFFFEQYYIENTSMEPTFSAGDQLAVNKISHIVRPHRRGDVIVFCPPKKFMSVVGSGYGGEDLIKRIVALEGDTVEVVKKMFGPAELYINGNKCDEPYIKEDIGYTLESSTVPKDCVFVLGDNRNASCDSHIWGALPNDKIVGRAAVKLWPPARAGNIEGAPA